jgi:integrase
MARRARNVYKRKDGRYEGRYIKGRDIDGKALYGYVYARTHAEVVEKRKAAISGAAAPQRIPAGVTVTEVVGDYLESKRSTLKASTIGVYRRYLDNHIAAYFGSARCDRLTKAAVESFVKTRLEAGLSPATVKAILAFLKTGVGAKADSCVFEANIPKVRPTEARCLSGSEQKRLECTASASSAVDFAAVTLGLYTGIRIGELCGLMWSDIDLERGIIRVRHTAQRIQTVGAAEHRTEVVLLSPKTQTSERDIPLPPFLVKILQEHMPGCGNGHILSRDGRLIEPRNIQYRFKRLLLKAGLRDINFHALRHTFATRALEQGFDIKTLSEILGHASATITMRIYTHALDGQRRRCMDMMANVWHSGAESGQYSGRTA